MNSYTCTKEQFLKDVASHELTVELDTGCHRSLLFKRPGRINHHFRLNTWPGHLSISGDMGSFVFSRLQDMFEFFRDDQLRINTGYWDEKLVAVSRSGGREEFDSDRFRQCVVEYFRQRWARPDSYSKRRDCWEEVREDLLDREFESAQEAMTAALEFQHEAFRFTDFWEHSITRPTYHLIWAMYAIVWGIQQYDQLSEPKESAA